MIIQTPTPQLDQSLSFYQKLGFTPLTSKNRHFVTDGKVIIEINTDRFARAGIQLYQTSWEKTAQQLKQKTTLINTPNGYLFSTLSGIWVYLIEQAPPIFDLDNITPAILGNFAGVSLETIAISEAMELWQILGFQKSMGAIAQGWVSLSNKQGASISIMQAKSCPHLFFNPSLTYFNGKNNLAIIDQIKAKAIPITEEITHFNKEGIADNIIIRDPGGFGFFIFSD